MSEIYVNLLNFILIRISRYIAVKDRVLKSCECAANSIKFMHKLHTKKKAKGKRETGQGTGENGKGTKGKCKVKAAS